MTRVFFTKGEQKPSAFVTVGLIIAFLAALALMAAGPIISSSLINSWLPYKDVVQTQARLITLTGVLVGVAASFTFIGILHGRFSKRARASWRAFVATMLCLIVGFPIWKHNMLLEAGPALHDVSTQTARMIAFEHMSERTYDLSDPSSMLGGRLSPDYAARHARQLPEIKPIQSPNTAAQAYAEVLNHAQNTGWDTVHEDAEKGDLEATYQSLWFGFRYQIRIEVRAKDAGSIVDMRLVSVEGQSDMGTGLMIYRQLKKILAVPASLQG